MRFKQWRTVISRSAEDINRNHTLAFAAALSYYFVMAFFPALIALAAIIAYLPIPNLFNTMVGTLSRVMPPESTGLIRKVVGQIITPNRGALLSFGLLGTLWSASGGFANMIEALNVAYDIPETRPIWKTRLLALELTFEVGTLILFAFSVMIVGPQFGAFLAQRLGFSWAFAVAWPYLRYAHGDCVRRTRGGRTLLSWPEHQAALSRHPAGRCTGGCGLDSALDVAEPVCPSRRQPE